MKRVPALLQAAALLCMICAAPCARAQELAQAPGVFDLGEIVVTTPEVLETTAATVEEITADQIQDSGAKNAAEAVENLPGIRLSAGGRKGESMIYLRGFDQNQIRIMLDGIPLEAPYFNEVDLSEISVDNIAKITVTKGGASAMYGADAMGGVINIVTRKPTDQGGSLTLGYGEFGETSAGLRWGGSNGNIYYSFSGRMSESEGYDLPSSFVAATNEDGGRRINSDYDRKAFSLLLGTTGKNTEYAFNFNFIDNERGSPVNTATTGYLNRFTTWKKWTVDMSGEQWLSDKAQLREKLYYHKYDNVLTGYTSTAFTTINTVTSGGLDISTYDDYTWGVRLLYDKQSSEKTLWKAALNYNKDVHEDQVSPGYVYSNYETDTMSLGLELERAISSPLTLTAGLGYDVLKQVSGTEALTATGTAPVIMGGDTNALSPSLGATYRINDKNSLFLSLSRKNSFPTQREFFSGRGAGSTSRNIGNPDLEPEKNSSREIGYETQFPCGTRLRTAAFHNNVSNYITTVRVGNKNYYVNLSRVVLKGLDTELKGDWGTKAHWTLGHTYLKAYNVSAPGTQLDRRPRNKTDMALDYDFNKFVSGHVRGSYFGAYMDSGTALGSYFIVNAGLEARRPDKKYTVRLNVENLFDRLYEEETGSPMPGRTMRLEMQYDF